MPPPAIAMFAPGRRITLSPLKPDVKPPLIGPLDVSARR